MHKNNIGKQLDSNNTIPLKAKIQTTPCNGEVIHSNKSLIIGKCGNDFRILKVESIAYFFVQAKIIFGVDAQNNKYRIEAQNLSGLVEKLDKKLFFKVNRNFILNCKFIQKYRKVDRVKTLIEMTTPVSAKIIVSQKGSIRFRNWIYNL